MTAITTTKTYGPFIMSYTSEGKVTITQQPSVHPLLFTPVVAGAQDARTITPRPIMLGKEADKNYRRDLELATHAAEAFSRVLETAEVEGFTA